MLVAGPDFAMSLGDLSERLTADPPGDKYRSKTSPDRREREVKW